jgi:hypothetical protein
MVWAAAVLVIVGAVSAALGHRLHCHPWDGEDLQVDR